MISARWCAQNKSCYLASEPAVVVPPPLSSPSSPCQTSDNLLNEISICWRAAGGNFVKTDMEAEHRQNPGATKSEKNLPLA